MRLYQRENRAPGVFPCPDVLAKHDKSTEQLFDALGAAGGGRRPDRLARVEAPGWGWGSAGFLGLLLASLAWSARVAASGWACAARAKASPGGKGGEGGKDLQVALRSMFPAAGMSRDLTGTTCGLVG